MWWIQIIATQQIRYKINQQIRYKSLRHFWATALSAKIDETYLNAILERVGRLRLGRKRRDFSHRSTASHTLLFSLDARVENQSKEKWMREEKLEEYNVRVLIFVYSRYSFSFHFFFLILVARFLKIVSKSYICFENAKFNPEIWSQVRHRVSFLAQIVKFWTTPQTAE